MENANTLAFDFCPAKSKAAGQKQAAPKPRQIFPHTPEHYTLPFADMLVWEVQYAVPAMLFTLMHSSHTVYQVSTMHRHN